MPTAFIFLEMTLHYILINTRHSFALMPRYTVLTENGSQNEEFKAMSEELATIENNNEAALADLYAEMDRATVYKKKYEALIAKMLEELGKTDNWYMSPPVLVKRKVPALGLQQRQTVAACPERNCCSCSCVVTGEWPAVRGLVWTGTG